MPKKKHWFVSHPSGGPQHTPTFFDAIEAFANEHVDRLEIVLPHEVTEKVQLTKDDIKDADLVLAEVSLASTGSGIELGWANAAGKDVICFYQGAAVISPAIHFVATAMHTYVTREHVNKVLATLL